MLDWHSCQICYTLEIKLLLLLLLLQPIGSAKEIIGEYKYTTINLRIKFISY